MTEIERQIIDAAKRGEWFRGTKPGQVVRAELIRELLLGRHGELDPRGVRLVDLRIQGLLDLNRVAAIVGVHFIDCVIDKQIQARSANLPYLIIKGGRCAGLAGYGLNVCDDLYLHNGLQIIVDDVDAPIALRKAHVGGSLDLQGVRITNTAGPAVAASGLQVDGSVYLRDGARIVGCTESSAINLGNAQIARNLELRHDVEVTNVDGQALSLGGTRVGGSVYLWEGVKLTGNAEHGVIDMIGAQIIHEVEFKNVSITSTAGPALSMDRTHVGGSFFMRKQIQFSGSDAGGAVDLNGAHFGGSLGVQGQAVVKIVEGSGPVLDLRDVVVGTSVNLPADLVCNRPAAGAKCGNTRLVRLDELAYTTLGAPQDWRQWLHLIRRHTPAYHASAYQRLAAVERAAGHDGTVRKILMAQQTDLRRRNPDALNGRVTRISHWLWGLLAGYGYQARRTALALLLVLVTAGALGWWAGQIDTRPGHLVAERVTSASAATGVPCSTVELIGLGLDRGLPLAMTGMRTRCDLDTASKKGQAFTAAIWLVQLAVWGLATLALAGYTNLVRKPG